MFSKRIFVFALLILLLNHVVVFADEKSKREKTLNLMKHMGMYDVVNEQMMTMRQQNQTYAQKLRSSLQSEFPQMSESYYVEAENEIVNFLEQLDASLDTTKLVNKWAEIFSQYLSENEIEQLIEFYSSSIGQKYVLAAKKAIPEWTQYFLLEYQKNLERETKIFFQKLRQIASKYKTK